MEAADEVHDDEAEEDQMRRRSGAADRAQEDRVDAFEHERAVEQRQRQHGDGGDGGEQQQRVVVERQHRAEEHVQQIHVRAAQRHDGDAERQGQQVEGRERRILLQRGEARDEAGGDRDDHAGEQPADGHRRQRQAGDEIADGRAGQDRVRHGIAGEAHAAQHQEDADRAAAERDGDHAHERALHELEFGKRRVEQVEHDRAPQATWRWHTSACGSYASTMRRAFSRFSALSTSRGLAPGHRLAGDQEGLREGALDHVEIVQDGDHGAGFVMPAADEIEQVGGGLGVDGGEGLVEQDHGRVLQEQAGEERPLHLAARQGRDRAPLEADEAHRRQRLLDPGALVPGDAAEEAGAGPQAHGDEIVDRERERAVDLGRLRQIGDAGVGPSRRIWPSRGFRVPTMPLSRVDLPAPFGPTTAIRLPDGISPSR